MVDRKWGMEETREVGESLNRTLEERKKEARVDIAEEDWMELREDILTTFERNITEAEEKYCESMVIEFYEDMVEQEKAENAPVIEQSKPEPVKEKVIEEKVEEPKEEPVKKEKKVVSKKEKRNKGIGKFVIEGLKKGDFEGMKNKEVAELVRKKFDGANTKATCISWYKGKLKRENK